MDTLIISCCAKKLDHAALPHQLYLNRAWDYARAHLADRFNLMALSAEYGLMYPGNEYAPYERKLDEKRAAKLIEISSDVRPCSMLSAYNETGSPKFYVYGGRLYRELVAFWCSTMPKAGWECIEVIGEGRGCGDHYKALTEL